MQLDVSNKPMVAQALSLAMGHHLGIARKYCGEPYINHPVRVAEKLLTYGFIGEDILSAALLHDCLEDENKHGERMTAAQMRGVFPERVVRWVELLSNTEKGNRAQRKAAAAKRIAMAPLQVQAIKLCDIMDNCKGIARTDFGFAEVYIAEKQALLKGLPATGNRQLAAIKEDCHALLSEEMNELALFHLENGQAMEAERKADDALIAQILAEEERSVFADTAMF